MRLPGGEALTARPGRRRSPASCCARAPSPVGPASMCAPIRRDVVGDEEIVPEIHPHRIKLLRLERLAPAVLLALFDGIPQLVHIEEPRQGIQFGVELQPVGDTGTTSAPYHRARSQHLRGCRADRCEHAGLLPPRARPACSTLTRTAQTSSTRPTNTSPAMDGAEFALQMIRFPYRQVFGRITATPRDRTMCSDRPSATCWPLRADLPGERHMSPRSIPTASPRRCQSAMVGPGADRCRSENSGHLGHQLIRHPRLLVPIDVQALFVARGSNESSSRLPFALDHAGRRQARRRCPTPFADGRTARARASTCIGRCRIRCCRAS